MTFPRVRFENRGGNPGKIIGATKIKIAATSGVLLRMSRAMCPIQSGGSTMSDASLQKFVVCDRGALRNLCRGRLLNHPRGERNDRGAGGNRRMSGD